jgi:hypothetical protein
VPSSAWEVASATADGAAKGTPSGKGKAGHHVTREVGTNMVGRNDDRSLATVIRSIEDSRRIARGHDANRGHDQNSKLQPKS